MVRKLVKRLKNGMTSRSDNQYYNQVILLVRNVGVQGRQRLADKWEDYMHCIQGHPHPNVPVYVVNRED